MSYHEILNTLLFYWKKIISFTVYVMIFLFLILFFIYPITFSSEVKILPPEEKSYNGVMGLLGQSDAGSLIGLAGSGGNSQLYAEILKSRSAAEYVIKKCSLLTYFNSDDIPRATEDLQKLLNVEVTKEGIILLSVDLKTPFFSRFSDMKDSINNLAAKTANAFVVALDQINTEKLNTKARKLREFIEEELSQTKINLNAAEEDLKIFQEKFKTISLPKQLEASIQQAAEIKSDIYMAEIQLKTMGLYMHEDNASMQALRQKLDILKKEYSKIEGGDRLNKDYLPDFEDVPDIAIRLARLTRNVKVLNEVYIMLQTQYYKQKIQENRDTPTVQVLDKAVPSIRAKSPRLAFHTFIGGVFGFLLISSVLIYQENKKKNLQTKNKIS